MSAAITDQHQNVVPQLTTALEPFQITRRQLHEMFNSPQLVKRMISAGWIIAVRAGKPGRETLFDFQSAKAAFGRLRAGVEPPPLTSRANHQPEGQQ